MEEDKVSCRNIDSSEESGHLDFSSLLSPSTTSEITDPRSAVSPEMELTPEEQKHERSFWYFGLSNNRYANPPLIARSSTHPFPYQNNSFSRAFPTTEQEPEPKRIFEVARHDIIDGYDAGVRSAVRDCLKNIPWYSIDVVRIGYGKTTFENPVVVLITADITKTNDEYAQRAVDDIHDLMIRHLLTCNLSNHWNDVHAEIKGGVLDKCDEERVPRQVPYIGTSVGARETVNTGGLTGTLSAFLKLDDEICGLTCHHCVKSDNDKMITSEIVVDQPSTGDFKRAIESLKADIEMKQKLCKMYDEDEQTRIAIDRPWSVRVRQAVEADRKLLQDYIRDLPTLETFDPTFGTVNRVSGISKDEETGFIRDWALITLNKDRFINTKPQNTPPIFKVSLEDQRAIGAGAYILKLEEINENAPFVEIEQALKITGPEHHMDMKSARVLKHGRTSGWTGGSLNQIRSDCRRGSLITTELCIVNLPSATAFSSPGDSGSLVFDEGGRVVGMLHSGNNIGEEPKTYSNEITYASPMEWLLEDIKKETGATSATFKLY
ncbi:hypothetical protein B7463_g1458, partial [Scytalidium lignicola]